MTHQIRSATVADLDRIVAIISQERPHPFTVEALTAMDNGHEEGQPLHRAVATDSWGAVLGHLVAFHNSSMRPGTFVAQIQVAREHRRMGVGTALERYLEEWVRAQGGTAIEGSVKEAHPERLAWATARGYAHHAHLFMSRLELPTWDPAPFLPAVSRAEAQGFRFSTVAAEGGMTCLPQLYDVMARPHADIPGWEGRPIFSMETFGAWIEKDATWNPEGVFVAIQGDTWAAVSRVDLRDGGIWAYNDFTGVARAFRGRSLSLPVKVLGLQWAKAQGAQYIKTENHSLNAPMIATNKRLGYIAEPGSFEVVRKLDPHATR